MNLSSETVVRLALDGEEYDKLRRIVALFVSGIEPSVADREALYPVARALLDSDPRPYHF